MAAALLLLTVLAGASALPTFYISSSNPAASDNNTGTSPSLPWRSLQRAVAAAPQLRAGGQLLLCNGDTWVLSKPLRFDGLGNASSAARLLLGSYQFGTSTQRPLILADSPSYVGPLLWLHDAQRIDVVGLELSGGEVGVELSFGELRDNRYTANLSSSITDCVIRGARSVASANGSTVGSAILLSAAHANITVSGLVLSNNAVSGCDAFYRTGDMPPFAGLWTVVHTFGLRVTGNFITATVFNTLSLMWMTDTLVTRNVFLRNGPPPGVVNTRGTTDIIMGTVDPSVVVDGNEVGYRGEGLGAPDGCALDFETASQGLLVSNNFFHHCWGAGILVFGHGTTSTGLRLENNTLLFNGCNQTSWDRGELALTKPNSSGTFTGGRVVSCEGVPWITPHWPSSENDWIFASNAVNGTTADVQVLTAPVVSQVASGAAGSLVITASCSLGCPPGATLRYSTDGAVPVRTSSQWPVSGQLTLEARTTPVLVKVFPPSTSPEIDERGRGLPFVVVESPAEGGLFAPL